MMSKKAIKVICIILAALMILSCVAVLLQTFAADANALALAIPATGDNDWDYLLPILLIGVAVIAIACVFIIPKLKKKD